MTVPDPRRGEIWRVDFNPSEGSEHGDVRPALVLSINDMNGHAGRSIVLPLTKTRKSLPTRLPIDPPEGGIQKASSILCDQIRSVSHLRFSEKLGEVSTGRMLEVEQVLVWLLGLPDPGPHWP